MDNGLIGTKISLTSKSNIRYRGTLAEINTEESSICLEQVTSMGTEDRAPPEFYMPPSQGVFESVIFKAQDVKDLVIETQSPPKQAAPVLPHDPAIMSVGQGQRQQSQAQPPVQQPVYQQYPPAPQQQRQQPPHIAGGSQLPPPPPTVNLPSKPQTRQPSQHATPSSSKQDFDSTIRKVEQALGDARTSNPRSQSNQFSSTAQGLPGSLSHKAPPVPKEAFDFEEMNKKFEKLRSTGDSAAGKGKAVLSSSKDGALVEEEDDESSDEGSDSESRDGNKAQQQASSVAYNKSSSFFDSVSSDVNLAAQGGNRGGNSNSSGGGRGRGGGGGYRWRREDEAAANLNTFGEVGGHSNHGRGGGRGGRGRGRGGFRGGRGGPHGGHAQAPLPSGNGRPGQPL